MSWAPCDAVRRTGKDSLEARKEGLSQKAKGSYIVKLASHGGETGKLPCGGEGPRKGW